MRIALFVDVYLPYINGVVTHVKVLKEGLEELGHTVLVVTADVNAKKHYIEDGILRCPAKVSKKIYEYGLSKPISRTRKKFIDDFAPDLIHIHQEFGIGFSGLAAAQALGIPLVYTMHTMYDEYMHYVIPYALIPAAKIITHSYARFIGSKATEITGPSKKIQNYFNNDLRLRKEINIIPNSAETNEFNLDRIPKEEISKIRSQLGIPDENMVVAFVGRLGREKSIDVLLDFWHKSITTDDKLSLMIIGGGPCADELKQQASELGIEDMIAFTGSIDHQDVPKYLACCTAYATASLTEVYSISMIEAMTMGLPVLQRFDPLNEGQVVDGINGFIFREHSDFGEYLKKIRNMTSQELEHFRQSVRDSVKQADSNSLAEYMLGVYEKALKEKNSVKKIFSFRQKSQQSKSKDKKNQSSHFSAISIDKQLRIIPKAAKRKAKIVLKNISKKKK